MRFITGTFLVALVAALGPTLIHLLNRRRFRTIEWAAMDFLEAAVRRSKRAVELRDLLLLLLRTLTVVFFVLALAQPFWSGGTGKLYGGEPVHAVVVVDNSLSMAYKPLDKTLLAVAKKRAGGFIKDLPKGSRISVIPLCGGDAAHEQTAFASAEDALEALSHIEIADRGGRAGGAAEKAKRACRVSGDMLTRRVVIFSDMQRSCWSETDLARHFEGLDNVQVVPVGPPKRGNTWVSEFRLLDSIADGDSPALFRATIRCEGEVPRDGLRVSLEVGGDVVDDRTVDLFPGQHLRLLFRHRFDVAGTSAEPLFVPVHVRISADELPEDNFRSLVVPVVARMPVVFVDQHGERELPRINRYGETYPLRRLLAAKTSADPMGHRLISARHLAIEELSAEHLRDARLVAVAGVRTPSAEAVDLLRQYVQRGGQLFIAAGAVFDPAAWTDVAWRDGNGILPAPLGDVPLGKLPPPGVVEWPAFRLDLDSLNHAVFDLDLTETERGEIMSSPFFYKAVGVDLEAMDAFETAQRARMGEYRSSLAEYMESEKEWTRLARSGRLTEAEARRREESRSRFEQVARGGLGGIPARRVIAMSTDQLVALTRPSVVGRYDNGEAFAMRRNIGKGSVMMMTSGCYPEWNNLAAGPSVLILDSMLRSLLARALPERNLQPVNEIVLPVAARDQEAEFHLFAPGREDPLSLRADPITGTTFGLKLADVDRRGIYRVRRLPGAGGAGEQDGEWSMLLALNGPASESELDGITRKDFIARIKADGMRWVGPEQPITLEGSSIRGRNLWKVLLVLVLVCLFVEMIMLREQEGGKKTP
jgi:hypothetical protein